MRRAIALAASLALGAAACTGTDDGAGDDSLTPLTDSTAESGAATDDTTTAETTATADEESLATSAFDIDAALAADPNCANPVTGDPLRIGWAADLSEIGGNSDGPGSASTLHMAKLINCSGGLNGRPVEVIVEDISGDPLATREAMLRLLDQDVHALMGPPFPDPGFRVLQVTNGNYPVIFMGSTEPALADNTALSYLVAFNDTQGATAAAEFALTKGWSRAVTFSFPGPYFGYNALVFSGVYGANGGEVVGDYLFIPGETEDFSEAVAEIAQDPPDVIYTTMFAAQLVDLRTQLEAAGVEVDYIQSDAFEATGGYTLNGTDGFYHITHASPEEGERINTLNESLTAASGSPPDAPSMVALAGDAVAVIADAYLRTNSLDPVVLGEAIADGEGIQGITGVLSYNGMGAPTKPIYIHQVVDGQATLAATIGG